MSEHSAPDAPAKHKKKCRNKHCHCVVVQSNYCGKHCENACDGEETCSCKHETCKIDGSPID